MYHLIRINIHSLTAQSAGVLSLMSDMMIHKRRKAYDVVPDLESPY